MINDVLSKFTELNYECDGIYEHTDTIENDLHIFGKVMDYDIDIFIPKSFLNENDQEKIEKYIIHKIMIEIEENVIKRFTSFHPCGNRLVFYK